MVVRDTSHESYFKAASPEKDPVAYRIWTKMIEGNDRAYTTNTAEAHDIIMGDDKMIYFSQELSAETTMQSYPCDIISSKSTYLHGYEFLLNNLPLNCFLTYAEPQNQHYEKSNLKFELVNLLCNELSKSFDLDALNSKWRQICGKLL